MTIEHFALVEDYYDDAFKLRVFICTDCGALIGNDFIENHQAWHTGARKCRACDGTGRGNEDEGWSYYGVIEPGSVPPCDMCRGTGNCAITDTEVTA